MPSKKSKGRNPHTKPLPLPPAPRVKQQALPEELALLQVLATTLSDTLQDSKLRSVLQAIKGHLYEKDFLSVFTNEEYLSAYAARWVPSRALAFRDLFIESQPIRAFFQKGTMASTSAEQRDQGSLEYGRDLGTSLDRIVCIGGGAGSEQLAIWSTLKELRSTSVVPKQSQVLLLDVGPYDGLVRSLEGGMRGLEEPDNKSTLQISFHQTDVLDPTPGTGTSLEGLCSPPTIEGVSTPPTLFTILFTITELFLQSRQQTLLLMRRITDLSKTGDLLLIADSANEEASSLTVGQVGRAFQLVMLLDHMMCGPKEVPEGAGGPPSKLWKLVQSEDSKWYRLREGLQEAYPAVKLENLRYWMRLYERV